MDFLSPRVPFTSPGRKVLRGGGRRRYEWLISACILHQKNTCTPQLPAAGKNINAHSAGRKEHALRHKTHSHVPRKHKTLLVHKLGKERFIITSQMTRYFLVKIPHPTDMFRIHSEGVAYYTNLGTYCSMQHTLLRIQVPHGINEIFRKDYSTA